MSVNFWGFALGAVTVLTVGDVLISVFKNSKSDRERARLHSDERNIRATDIERIHTRLNKLDYKVDELRGDMTALEKNVWEELKELSNRAADLEKIHEEVPPTAEVKDAS